MHKLRVAGLMSGTSLDGLSIGYVDIRDRDDSTDLTPIAEFIAGKTFRFPDDLRAELLELAESRIVTSQRVAETHRLYGENAARCLVEFLAEQSSNSRDIHLVGFHGQTIYHQPRRGGQTTTFQIGDPSQICFRLGIPVVSDFRSMDSAAGGQGAPLVPMVDYLKYRSDVSTRVILNIGGIANLTLLRKGGKLSDVIALDTGPGNMLIDATVQIVTKSALDHDIDGMIASKGNVSEALLALISELDDYRLQPYPKTTGRERYGRPFAEDICRLARGNLSLRDEDIVATVTHYTVRMVNYHLRILEKRGLPKADEIIVGGGGTKNPYLMGLLRRNDESGARVSLHSDYGVPSDFWECYAFALLAFLSFNGWAGNVPSATGASAPVLLGRLNFHPKKTIE